MDNEEWRKCIGLDCYEVSESGIVRRIAKGIRGGEIGKIMKPYVREDGYRMYILRQDNKSFHRKAHRLVCEAFVAPKPEGKWEVCHNDGTRNNDHWTNLRWGTRSENTQDMFAHGTARTGEKAPMCKLTKVQVDEIRASSGIFQRVLGETYGVSQTQIGRILRKERWAHE